jgi:hypothetical protein
MGNHFTYDEYNFTASVKRLGLTFAELSKIKQHKSNTELNSLLISDFNSRAFEVVKELFQNSLISSLY